MKNIFELSKKGQKELIKMIQINCGNTTGHKNEGYPSIGGKVGKLCCGDCGKILEE